MKKIKTVECVSLVVNFICVKVFLLTPQIITNAGKSISWLFVLINAASMLLAFYIVNFLFKKDNGNFLKSKLSRIFSVLCVIYFVITAGLTTTFFTEGLLREFLPTTKGAYIIAFLLFAVFFCARKGKQICAQISVIIMPLIVLIILFLCVLLTPFFETTNLYPLIYENTDILKGSFLFNFFSDFVLFYLVAADMPKNRDRKKAGLLIIKITTVIYLAFSLMQTLVIPPHIQSLSPFNQLSLIVTGDSIMVSFYLIIKYLYILCFLLYLVSSIVFSADALKQSFDIDDKNPLYLPITLCVFFVSQMFVSIQQATAIYKLVNGLGFYVFFIILILAGLINGRKTNEAI